MLAVTPRNAGHYPPSDRFAQFGDDLLGHSLGAGLAPLLAGSLPDRIAGLICLDGLGPSPRPDEDAAQQFRTALDAKAGALRGGVGSCYASLEAAVDARLATVARHPGSHATGSQYLSRGAATALRPTA